MKKLLYLLLLLPLGFLASCQSDDDLPNVDITVTFDNVANVNNALYVVQGEEYGVQSLSIKSNTDKKAAISTVTYSFDQYPAYVTNEVPFGVSFDSSVQPLGTHLLDIDFDVLQIDKSISYTTMSYYVKVVKSADDIPDGAVPGTVTLSYTVNPKK